MELILIIILFVLLVVFAIWTIWKFDKLTSWANAMDEKENANTWLNKRYVEIVGGGDGSGTGPPPGFG